MSPNHSISEGAERRVRVFGKLDSCAVVRGLNSTNAVSTATGVTFWLADRLAQGQRQQSVIRERGAAIIKFVADILPSSAGG